MYGAPGGGPTVHDPMTLPVDDNVNSYTFCVELKGSQWFLQKGKMIAYYGSIDFNGVGHGGWTVWCALPSIRLCTRATGSWRRARARCSSPTGPST